MYCNERGLWKQITSGTYFVTIHQYLSKFILQNYSKYYYNLQIGIGANQLLCFSKSIIGD